MPGFVKENWIFLQQHLWPGPLMFVIFLVSLGILAVDKKGSARRLFWYSVILLAGVVYNPYFWYALVNRIYKDDNLVQLRLAWLVPAFLIMAYAMCRVAFLVKKWQISIVIAAAFVVLIWFAGVPFHTDVVVRKENVYKISEDAKESADAILADMEENPEHLKERPDLLEFNTGDYNDDIDPANFYHYGIRQYTSALTVHPVPVDEEACSAEDFAVTNFYNMPCQYLAYEVGAEPVGESAERVGYTEIARTDGHAIMRYHRDTDAYLVIRGETTADAAGKLPGGDGPSSLTEEGILSMEKLGQSLSDVEFSSAYADEAGDAKQSAEVILGARESSDNSTGENSDNHSDNNTDGNSGETPKLVLLPMFNDMSDDGSESRDSVVQRFHQGMGAIVKNLKEDGDNLLVVANPSAAWWLQEYAVGGDELGELNPGDCVKLSFTDGVWTVEGMC